MFSRSVQRFGVKNMAQGKSPCLAEVRSGSVSNIPSPRGRGEGQGEGRLGERPGRLLTLWTGSIPDTFTARL